MKIRYNYKKSDGSLTILGSYDSKEPSETLKTLLIAQENNLSLFANDFDSSIDCDVFRDCGGFVEEVYLIIGTEEAIPMIEVILD